MDLKTMSKEQRDKLKKGIEECIFFTNKVLVQWRTISGKDQFVSDYSQVRGLLRGHIRKYLSGIVDYRALSNFEYSVTIGLPATNPYIKTMCAYSVRSGSFDKWGGYLEQLNTLFNELRYEDLMYTIAGEEERRFKSTSNSDVVLKEIPQSIADTVPSGIATLIDYDKLNKIKF